MALPEQVEGQLVRTFPYAVCLRNTPGIYHPPLQWLQRLSDELPSLPRRYHLLKWMALTPIGALRYVSRHFEFAFLLPLISPICWACPLFYAILEGLEWAQLGLNQ